MLRNKYCQKGDIMPPIAKFSKEEVIKASLEIVRKEGIDRLTARDLATALSSSTKVIFGLFSGMDELKSEVIKAAYYYYLKYIDDAMHSANERPYLASGIAYIGFAEIERELFKLLFMRDRSGEDQSTRREDVREILDAIMNNTGMSEDEAFLFHMKMWIVVHGIAVMIATSFLDWNEEQVRAELETFYGALIGEWGRI